MKPTFLGGLILATTLTLACGKDPHAPKAPPPPNATPATLAEVDDDSSAAATASLEALTPSAPRSAQLAAASSQASALPTVNTIDCATAELAATDEAALRRRAEADDACAMATLADRLRERARTGAAYREAAKLLRRAHDLGADTDSCQVFDLGIGMNADPARAAACQRRSDRWVALAAAHALGIGVARDVTLAQQFLDAAKRRDGHANCTHDQVQELIVDNRAGAASGSPFCNHAACTTVAMNVCTAWHDTRDSWLAAQRRDALVAKLPAGAKARVAQLMDAMVAYADEESSCTYWEHSDGTMRGMVAIGQRGVIRDAFDRALSRFASDSLPGASKQRLAELRKEVAALRNSQQQRSFIFPGHEPEFRAACRKAQLAFGHYEQAWADLATAGKLASARSVRAAVLHDRIELLRDNPLE